MTDERAMRFGYLLSEIEMNAKAILHGQASDIPLTLAQMKVSLDEATGIAYEVSREALDKVVNEEKRQCSYRAEPEQWVASLHADESGLVQCMKEEGHDGPHLMP